MAENDTTRIALSRPCDSDIVEGGNISSDNSATASVSSSFSSSSLTSSSDDCSNSNNDSSFDDQTTKNLWWIHGDGYDLNDFVQAHPGGIEAILLGKGRDCTALVESYHPFSVDRVWKILEKHRCHNVSRCHNNDDEKKEEKENNNNKKDDEKLVAAIKRTTITTTNNSEFESMTERRQQEEQQHQQRGGGGRVPDFFYEILKKRVAKVLRSNGIDPLKDRGASSIRIFYYLMIFILWSYAGYLHCTVRFYFLYLSIFDVCIDIDTEFQYQYHAIYCFHYFSDLSDIFIPISSSPTTTTIIGKVMGIFCIRYHGLVDGSVRS
jgi:hypothetical protein